MSRRQKAPATSTRRRRPRRAALRSADGAKRSALTSYPAFIEPCHPTERNRPPWGDRGFRRSKRTATGRRCMCVTARPTVHSRRGYDWTETFASIARTAEKLPVRHAVLDGEAIVQNAKGVADYHALRRELARKRVSIVEAPGLPLGAVHTIGPIPSTSASLSPFGWRPSKIASTMSGARQVSGSSRQT